MKHRLSTAGALLLACACSSSSNTTGSDGGGADVLIPPADTGPGPDQSTFDSSSFDAGSSDAGNPDAPPVCNTLTDVGQSFNLNFVAMDAPAPQGGTPVDGTYALTDAKIYTGTGGQTGVVGAIRQAIQIMGATIQFVDDSDPMKPTERETATLVTSGTSFTATDTCPDNTVAQGSYTATAMTFTVFLPAGALPEGGMKLLVETYTKQ